MAASEAAEEGKTVFKTVCGFVQKSVNMIIFLQYHYWGVGIKHRQS
jgi:hypothetical protein